jgi:hypothetical protein
MNASILVSVTQICIKVLYLTHPHVQISQMHCSLMGPEYLYCKSALSAVSFLPVLVTDFFFDSVVVSVLTVVTASLDS